MFLWLKVTLDRGSAFGQMQLTKREQTYSTNEMTGLAFSRPRIVHQMHVTRAPPPQTMPAERLQSILILQDMANLMERTEDCTMLVENENAKEKKKKGLIHEAMRAARAHPHHILG